MSPPPPVSPAAFDQRTAAQLLACWEEWRGLDAMPAFGKFDAARLGEGHASSFVLDLGDAVRPPVLLQVGEALSGLRGPAASGRAVRLPLLPWHLFPRRLWQTLLRVIDAIATERSPLGHSGQLPPREDGAALAYRALLAPFSEDGLLVTHLVGAIAYHWGVVRD